MRVDTFLLYNELDVLDVRLHTLKDAVDRFVLVESTQTFSGASKPLYYDENRSLFREFPIEHVVVEEMPATHDRWMREAYQRSAIQTGLAGIGDNDYVMVSDVDEIPHPASIGHLGTWSMTTYYYTVNQVIDVYQLGPTACLYRDFVGAQHLRDQRPVLPVLHDACWHFSFFGGIERMAKKIHAFSHAEYDQSHYTDAQHLQQAKAENRDLFERGYPMSFRSTEDTLPSYLLENRSRFKEWFG